MSGERRPLLDWCRRHCVFLTIFVVAVGWRTVAELAFRPALVVPQSEASWFTDHRATIAVGQHLLGLAAGVVGYAALLRRGVWRWLAAAAMLPVLWSGWMLASEQLMLPDAVYVFLVTTTIAVLCWRACPSSAAALLVGLLAGTAATVRPSAGALVVTVGVFLLLTGRSWRERFTTTCTSVVGFAVPVVAYVLWYHHAHGEYTLEPTRSDLVRGTWLFGSYDAPDPGSLGHGAANALVSWEGVAQVPQPLALGGAALAVLAAVGLGRAATSRMRAVCLLWAALPAATLLGTVVDWDAAWRNQLPGLLLWPAAGALGLTALLRGRRGAASTRAQVDDVDLAAQAEFAARYSHPVLAPVVVVIAAYNEAAGLPAVLAGLPSSVCDLDCDVVVVDDGSSDDTAAVAIAAGGAYVVACGVNRGQGAAMRLGYRMAREHGAHYIITTDADGQYDTDDFPVVLAPILDGSADFVTGSRRLGRQFTRDRFRRTGVYVFAWTVSLLTGRYLTDTSFGLRAMRAELTAAVTLNQPQYQSSELLIGVLSHGYRVAEVPGTMHVRSQGSTKKGGNLVYGSRYARVVFGTWWREGCPTPAPQQAPALVTEADRSALPPALRG